MTDPQTTFAIGQKAFIVNSKGLVLIIKRFKADGKQGFWDFPGGRVQPHESLRSALTREVLEESGLKLSQVSIPLSITTFLSAHARNNQTVRIIYLCKTTNTRGAKISSEHNEIKWISPKDHNNYPFPDEDYHQAFSAFLKLKNPQFEDFLGNGMLEESLQFVKKSNHELRTV